LREMTIPRNVDVGRSTFSKKETKRMCFHKLFVSLILFFIAADLSGESVLRVISSPKNDF